MTHTPAELRAELEKLTQADLDEMVYELKADEASEINNQGREVQIAYLLEEEGPKKICKSCQHFEEITEHDPPEKNYCEMFGETVDPDGPCVAPSGNDWTLKTH